MSPNKATDERGIFIQLASRKTSQEQKEMIHRHFNMDPSQNLHTE